MQPMKVVLFCGGLGTRMREYSESIPKPMALIGSRPILWHLMHYYAHFGHKEFILCLGYKADVIKNYFLNYNECLSNDFTLSQGGKQVELLKTDIQDWKITFVDTGIQSNIGQRLKAVEQYLRDDEVFLANYSDGLTNLDLRKMIDYAVARRKIACFLSVRPIQSFHVVAFQRNDLVRDIQDLSASGIWINGGFFVLRKEIFKYLRKGEDLVYEPFQRLIKIQELMSYQYDGFWASMDTFKDKQRLDDMYSRGDPPWEVWKSGNGNKRLSARPGKPRSSGAPGPALVPYRLPPGVNLAAAPGTPGSYPFEPGKETDRQPTC
jgi:glucose-1-phosphate cytidylyltransferase